MTLTYVNELPKVKRGPHMLQAYIEEFMNSDGKIVKIDFNEKDYKSPNVCYSVWKVAVKRSGRLVKVAKRGDEVYLVKI